LTWLSNLDVHRCGAVRVFDGYWVGLDWRGGRKAGGLTGTNIECCAMQETFDFASVDIAIRQRNFCVGASVFKRVHLISIANEHNVFTIDEHMVRCIRSEVTEVPNFVTAHA
jgi:hypothetical protein